jgi:hypothetical protein
MATHRGFVQSIQIDRAAVATIVVVHADASIGTYIIQDLDGDPERFNERLSKLAILRDAMNRAEPVEIEHETIEQGEEIEIAIRITRDAIAPLSSLEQHSGIVVDLVVLGQNGVDASGDIHCQATVTLLAADLSTFTAILDLQLPERLVASDQLDMLRDAQNTGSSVRLVVSTVAGASPNIVSVALGDAYGSDGGTGSASQISGFVETLSLIKDFPTESTVFAHVRFTTAPDFSGPGNSVSNAPFDPQTIDLLVPRSSPAYDLFEVALRDKLRMRVQATQVQSGGSTAPPGSANLAAVGTGPPATYSIVSGAELVAPLASASRPVWVKVTRESLDCGPQTEACADGVPSSDLTVSTLRDLKIPYAACWEGIGCFNHGVYRFQFQLASPFKVAVDCKTLCLHDSTDPTVKFAYACLDGDHCVEICFEKWTCDQEFNFDVYRLR